MRPVIRFGLIVLLLGGLVGLAVHYDATYDDQWPYPPAEAVAENPPAYEGAQLLFIGRVESVDTERATLVYRPDDDLPFTLTATEVDATVSAGGTVHIYGPIEDDGSTHRAERVVVVNEDVSDRNYKLVTSVIGVLLTVGLFFRYWRPEPRSIAFEERDRDG